MSKNFKKLILAGLVVGASLSQTVEALDLTNSKEVLLAVASCGTKCGKSAPDYGREQIADNAGELSSPRYSSQGGNYGSQNSSYNQAGSYGSYSSSSPNSYQTVPGGNYGSAGNASEGGSWEGANRSGYNYHDAPANRSSYNTNRGFETSPSYQGQYWDSSSSSSSVAPYGYSNKDNRSNGYDNVSASGVITEAQLLPQLSESAKDQYRKLSPEGKAVALQLASQSKYANNKNQAISDAKNLVEANTRRLNY